MSRIRIPWQREHPFRYSITEWEIDTDRTGLLLMDFQAGYVRPAVGLGPRLARDFPQAHASYYPRLRDTVLPNAVRLLEAFRRLDLPVVFTRLGSILPGGRDLPSWSWRAAAAPLYAPSEPEHELVAELTPTAEEMVVDRTTLCPFNSSPLDQCLRNMGVENLVIAGVRTEAAPETTARDAGERGYTVFLVEDACATLDPREHADVFGHLAWAVERSTVEVLDLLDLVAVRA